MNKIILITYFKISKNSSKEQINKIIESFSVGFDQAFKEDYHCFYIPIYDGDSRVECINPKLVDDEDYENLNQYEEALVNYNRAMMKIIKKPKKLCHWVRI